MPNYATSSLYNLIYNKNIQKGGSINKNVFKSILNNKKFLLLTFSNLILQLGITYYFMETYKEKLSTPYSRTFQYIIPLELDVIELQKNIYVINTAYYEENKSFFQNINC